MAVKLFGVLVVAFLIFFMITAPTQAHHIVDGLGHLIAKIATGLRDFVNSFS